ncbi:MAG: rod shape-determining protein MreC [Candidatus Kapabacteria bacterium]|nr:rod shape-determining protein MreC [Candidatus Kapabacteria bacterium]MDW8012104.1 rod shape-determining protein MreC [Bacteroidota bacterium]
MLLQRIAAFFVRFRQYVILAALLLLCVGLMQLGQPTAIPGLTTFTVGVLGVVQGLIGAIPNPAALRRENELLARLNTALLLETISLRQAVAENKQFQQLSELRQRLSYPLVFARVVGLTVGQLRSYAILDKGSSDGLRPAMPVVAPAGLVGRVQAVSPHFAVVELLDNRGVRVAVRLESSSAEGILAWKGVVGEFALEYIPTSVSVQAGERVVTSASSDRFPPGIPVGTVQEVTRDPTTPFYRIRVVPAVAYQSLQTVAVLLHRPNPERRALEERLLRPEREP